MIHAVWKDKHVYADDVARTEQYETEIRKAGSRNELRCTDPDCEYPHVIYKHGPEVIPHFAHKKKGNCDYAVYDENFRVDKSVIKDICSELYRVMTSNGYKVWQEVKIPGGHTYAHLMIEVGEKTVALQVQSSATSANYNARVEEDCKNAGYDFQRIIIGDPDVIQKEKHTYHIIRYQYNHSANKDLIIIDENGTEVSQTKEDNNDYTYKGRKPGFSSGYHNSFQLKSTPDNLVFENGNLSIKGFNEKYSSFLEARRKEFELFKKNIDEAETRRKKTIEYIAASPSSQPVEEPIQVNKPSKSEIKKERLIKEGKFTGERIDGKEKWYSLEDIKADKKAGELFEPYVKYEQMRTAVEKAFSGNKTDVQILLNRMCNATEFEKEFFREVYSEILSEDDVPEIYMDILNYIIIEAKL